MLVGRMRELERLDALAAAAQAGQGGRLLVVGEPGIGRTALLDAAHHRAARSDLAVVHLRVGVGEGSLPHSLLEDLERGVRSARGTAPIRPDWDHAVLDLLDWLVAQGPALLLVDDADCADPASLATLHTALQRIGAAPLSAAVATRPVPGIVAHFPDWDRLLLGPLRPDAAAAILRAALGPGGLALDPIVDALHGNPMTAARAPEFLTEAQLSGQALLPDPMPVPDALATSWSLVLDRLSPAARAALVDLALAGPHLEVLTGMSDSGTPAALDELMAAGLATLDPSGAPVLVSALLRSVVLTRSPPDQLRSAHARAGRAGQALGRPPGEVVAHLRQSVILGDTATATAIAAQASRAEAAGHLETASRAWGVAARMTTDPTDRVRFALSAVRLAYWLGVALDDDVLRCLATAPLEPDDRERLYAVQAEQRIDAEPRATLAMLWGIVDRVQVAAPQAALLPLFDAAHLAWLLGDPEAGLRAARLFADLGAAGWRDPDGILPPWTATALLAAALFQAGDTAAATPLRRRAIEAAREVDPWTVDVNLLLSIIAIDDDLLDTSRESTDRLHAVEQRLDGGESVDPCRVGIKAWRARASGQWSAARGLVAEGRPLAEAAGLTAPWLGMTALSAELASLCGDEDLLRREARVLREVGSRWGDRRRLATLDRALGLHALVGGNLEEAIACLTAAADVPFLGRGLRDGVLPARVDLVEALVRTGQLAEAARRHAALHPLLAGMEDPSATALDERAAALVAGGEDVESHYRQALAAHALAGDAFEQGRTELLFGEHLRRARRRTEARTHLQRAVHAFDALGAKPWAGRASQELRAAGGRAVGTVDPEPEIGALTAQERAVARAVADGMTNREAADTLFLSVRTVEYHLGNVYRKLGVHGRGALARALDPADPPTSRAGRFGRAGLRAP